MQRILLPLATMLTLLGIFSGSLALSVLYAECPCDNQMKTYVSPRQISVNEKGILIQFNEKWFQTNGLFSDATGIFVVDLNPSVSECPDPYVSCRHCKRCIYEAYDICPYCGKNA